MRAQHGANRVQRSLQTVTAPPAFSEAVGGYNTPWAPWAPKDLLACPVEHQQASLRIPSGTKRLPYGSGES